MTEMIAYGVFCTRHDDKKNVGGEWGPSVLPALPANSLRNAETALA